MDITFVSNPNQSDVDFLTNKINAYQSTHCEYFILDMQITTETSVYQLE